MINFNALFNCYAVMLCFCGGRGHEFICLLNDDNKGWQMINNFSLRQRLHLLLVLS